MAIVDVFRAPVISRKGLDGIKLNIKLGSVTAFAVASEPCKTSPRATSATVAMSPTAVNPNTFAMPMPTAAATMVVSINVPIVSALILPRELAPLSFKIAPMIDTIINGITIICNSFT